MIRILTFAIAGPPIAPLLVWLVGMPILVLIESGQWQGPSFSIALFMAGLAYYKTMIFWLMMCLAHWTMSRWQIGNRPFWCGLIALVYSGVLGYFGSPVLDKTGYAVMWGISTAIAAATCAWLTDKQYEAAEKDRRLQAKTG
ncbi:MAG: hypothetical protein ACRC9K_24090 [Afipia sp.]